MKLSGKTALVTGGGTGIGRAIALALAEEGCHVAVAGRREEPLREVAKLFSGEPKIEVFTADVSDRESANALVSQATKKLGKIDILVNNAGINTPRRSLAELDPADWDRLMNVNATGAYNCIHAVMSGMVDRGDGLIVNISSTSGKRAGLLGGVAYNASKFAMAALGISAALELGDKGIRVTNVFPGEVETPILDNRPVPVSAEHRARILQGEDIAAAVLMVACLPPRAHVAELVIKPTTQPFQ